jgi:hypothetical protein
MPEISLKSILQSSTNDIYIGYLNIEDLSDLPNNSRITLIDLNETTNGKTFISSESGYVDFTTPNFYALVQYKWVLLKKVAARGFKYTIFSDFDVFWNQDPTSVITAVFEKYPEVDFQIQTYTSDPSFDQLCMGFVSIRNSPKTLEDLSNLQDLHANMSNADEKTGDDNVISLHYKENKEFRNRVRTLPQSTFPTGNMINIFARKNQFPGLVPYQPYIFHANFVIGNAKKIGLLRTFIYNSQFGHKEFWAFRRWQVVIYLVVRRVGFSVKKLIK